MTSCNYIDYPLTGRNALFYCFACNFVSFLISCSVMYTFDRMQCSKRAKVLKNIIQQITVHFRNQKQVFCCTQGLIPHQLTLFLVQEQMIYRQKCFQNICGYWRVLSVVFVEQYIYFYILPHRNKGFGSIVYIFRTWTCICRNVGFYFCHLLYHLIGPPND